MKRNVYLVNLGTSTDRNLLPLSIGLIASYCQNQPEINDAFALELVFLRSDPASMAAAMEDPAVVGISCYSWHYHASLALARAIKQRHPRCLIVCGAYSVPTWPQRIRDFVLKYPYVDVLVHGEGEIPFANILRAVARGDGLEPIPGLSVRQPSGEMLTTPPATERVDLNDIPSPFLNGLFDRLMQSHGDRITGAIWETSRGCPYSCAFCAWGKTANSKVRKVDIDRLFAEIDWIVSRRIFYIYAADANFGMFFERDMAIAERLAEACRQHGYPRYLAWNWAKHNSERILAIADRLRQGGIHADITLAIQSFHPPTLEAVKRHNIPLDQYLHLKKIYQQRGVPTYTELILGLPLETYESFRAGMSQTMTSFLGDKFTVHLCMILECSEMADPLYLDRYRIETRTCVIGMCRSRAVLPDDPDAVETEDLVVGTSTLSTDEWRLLYVQAYTATALHAMRLAFFPMLLLRHGAGRQPLEFIDFLIAETDRDPAALPALAAGLARIRHQRDQVLAGICSLSPVSEAEGRMLGPAEAAVIDFLDDGETFHANLLAVLRRFCAVHQLALDDDLLVETVRYQQMRMPLWPVTPPCWQTFQHDLPAYFEALTNGHEATLPARRAVILRPILPRDIPADPAQFVIRRVVGGHTIPLHEVELHPEPEEDAR